MMGSLLTFFFFFFSALPFSVSLSRSLLGELVHCFLTGGSTVLSGISIFLVGISLPLPLSLVGVSLVSVFLGMGPVNGSARTAPSVRLLSHRNVRVWFWECCASALEMVEAVERE